MLDSVSVPKSNEDSNSNGTIAGKRKQQSIIRSAVVEFKHLGIPVVSKSTGRPCDSIHLEPHRVYSIGRCKTWCQFLVNDRRISKMHYQLVFDANRRKVFILDGSIFNECGNADGSLNGVFINQVRLKKRMPHELCAGDEVLLVCNGERCIRIGFVIHRIVIMEEEGNKKSVISPGFSYALDDKTSTMTNTGRSKSKRVFASRSPCSSLRICRVRSILARCKDILHSADPISSIQKCPVSFEPPAPPVSSLLVHNDFSVFRNSNLIVENLNLHHKHDTASVLPSPGPKRQLMPHHKSNTSMMQGSISNRRDIISRALQRDEAVARLESKYGLADPPVSDEHSHQGVGHLATVLDANTNSSTVNPMPPSGLVDAAVHDEYSDQGFGHLATVLDTNANSSTINPMPPNFAFCSSNGDSMNKTMGGLSPLPKEKICLNRLENVEQSSSGHSAVISLHDLLYPIGNIQRIFIATFTSDIAWFLSYCQIPRLLPVTIACHDSDICWSSSPNLRTSVPCPEFPNVVVVYPLFPETIAFGGDRKKRGIACHHPKFFVVQREDSIRVVVTSANLVAKQWTGITNTVWWQDFPRRSVPDYSSLFTQISHGVGKENLKSDFAAQLAGFMASLLIGAPCQAHWVSELTKYDFDGATGYLITSIPGIHSYRKFNALDELGLVLGGSSLSFGSEPLALVEASVVGLSHLFHGASDAHGMALKKLAAIFSRSHTYAHGMLKVVLRRNRNIPADRNAVSILVYNTDGFSEGEHIPIGFLPRNIAMWVSPLWDEGFFTFSGYVCCEEVLAAALGGNTKKVRLLLLVLQGPHFTEMSGMMQREHVVSFSHLIASIPRCTGLSRIHEVLNQYSWPESLETDFFYAASSIGSSVNAQFLAGFSEAAGKKCVLLSDSEESDPGWGIWTASQESKTPSIKIIFPTIERVKNVVTGISSFRRILCFSEKTWEKLRKSDILHDTVPYPCDRIGYPVHFKVAMRRFQPKTSTSSFGWVYCGSHNLSAAAWGRVISKQRGAKANDHGNGNSCSMKLHISNYELGMIFVVPPGEAKGSNDNNNIKLDDIILPFIVPAPKYKPDDRPATAQAMREAAAEFRSLQGELSEVSIAELVEEIQDEEELVNASDNVLEENKEETSYANLLWSQVDSEDTC